MIFGLLLTACADEPSTAPDAASAMLDDFAVDEEDMAARSLDLATPDLTAPTDFALFPDGANEPLLVSHDDWVATCQSLAACILLYGMTSVSDCIGFEQQPGHSPPLSPPVIACVRSAGADCTKIAACLNAGDPNIACDPATVAPACYGNDITYCNQPGIRTALDCSPFGFICSSISNPGCGLGACTGNGSACVDGVAGGCAEGRLIPRDDCRMYAGASCDVDAGACAGSGASCTSGSCNGSTLVACREGHEVTFDCAQLGLTCVMTNVGPHCALGSDCTAANTDTCNGNVLTYCNAGLLATFDCVAAGWKSCSEPADAPGACSP